MFNKESIKAIYDKHTNGLKIKRSEKIFKDNILGLRRSGVDYNFSKEELFEYSKCYNDVYYFIETYLDIKLQDYQKRIIEHYQNNRFSIFMNSRQTGVPKLLMMLFLHQLIFSVKNILVVNGKALESSEQMGIIKRLYKKLPFFIQSGINTWNVKNLSLENGSRATFHCDNLLNVGFGANYDIILLCDVSRYTSKTYENFVSNIFPILVALKSSKLILSSRPNGYNHFLELVQNSERNDNDPLKNNYETLRTYWWEIDGRDETWKMEQIKKLGSELYFRQEYDLEFLSVDKGSEVLDSLIDSGAHRLEVFDKNDKNIFTIYLK